jgi:hypothetical protein
VRSEKKKKISWQQAGGSRAKQAHQRRLSESRSPPLRPVSLLSFLEHRQTGEHEQRVKRLMIISPLLFLLALAVPRVESVSELFESMPPVYAERERGSRMQLLSRSMRTLIVEGGRETGARARRGGRKVRERERMKLNHQTSDKRATCQQHMLFFFSAAVTVTDSRFYSTVPDRSVIVGSGADGVPRFISPPTPTIACRQSKQR